MLKKKCNTCGISKDVSDFHFRNKKANKLKSSCKVCIKEKKKLYKSIPENKYKVYKYEALRRDLEFKLTFDEFKSFDKKPCFYCGEKLNSICLDRVDNNIGYVFSNVVSCCFKCNSIKHAYEVNEFLNHIEKIFIHQQRIKNDKQESFG